MPLTKEETAEMNQLSMEIEEADIDRQIAELESRADVSQFDPSALPSLAPRFPAEKAPSEGLFGQFTDLLEPQGESIVEQIEGFATAPPVKPGKGFGRDLPSEFQTQAAIIENLLKEIIRLPKELISPVSEPFAAGDPIGTAEGVARTAEGLARFFPSAGRTILNLFGAEIPTPPPIGEPITEEAFRAPTAKETQEEVIARPAQIALAAAPFIPKLLKTKVKPSAIETQVATKTKAFKRDVPLAEVSKGVVKEQIARPGALVEKPPEPPKLERPTTLALPQEVAPKPVAKPIPKVPEVTKPAPTVPKAEKVAPVAPVKAPEVVKKPLVVEKAPIEPEIVSLKKRTIEQDRKNLNLEKLSKAEAKGFKEVHAEAIETGAKGNALELTEKLLKSPRAIDPVEHVGMTLKYGELKKDRFALEAATAKEATKKNIQGVKRGQSDIGVIQKQMDDLLAASDIAGREGSRAHGIRRIALDANDFSVTRLRNQAKVTIGKDLSEKQAKVIESQAKKIETAERKVAELEKKHADILDNEAAIIAERVHQRELRKGRIGKGTKQLKEKFTQNKESILKRLNEIGVRIKTGLDPEAAFLVGKLAVEYSKSGVATLKGVVRKVLNDLPDLVERDVIQSINAKNPKLQKKARTQAQKNTQLLKREARLIIDLEAAEKGLFKRLPQKGEKAFGVQATTLRNIKVMQSKIRALKANFNQTISDGKRLQRAFDTVAQLEDQLSGLRLEVKKRRASDPIFIKALKEKAVELRKLLRTQDEIASLKKQLETGDFIIKEKRILKRQPQDLERAQVELNQLRKKVRRTIEDWAPLTWGKVTQETINMLRTFKATADMSYLMRQGLWLSARRPGLALKVAGKAIQATFSELKAEQINNAMRQAPHHYIRELMGIEFTEIGGRIRAGEEVFMSRWAEKVPVWGRVVKASERNMTTGLNLLRAGVADEFITKFPNATLQEMKAYGNYINVATGRGNLGRFGNASKILGSVFFAPRFAASRFQTPYALYKNLKIPRVRNEIAYDMAAVGGIGIIVLALADLAGADVTFDFDSADFGKIKVGNTSVDIWGGFQQPMRLIMQAGATPFRAKIAWGQDPVDLISRFSQYKLGPGITLPRQLIAGRTVFGEKTTIPETLARSVTPIFLESMIDAYQEGGRENAIALNALDLFGVSVNTYKRATK